MTTPALTRAQKNVLKAAVQAQFPSTDFTNTAANDVVARDWLNAAASWTVWKTNVSVNQIGDKINGTELAGLSSLNTTRLQMVVMLSPMGVNPSLADRRQFFDDIFSGSGGATTRANLLALWKRTANNLERLLSTGTGSDASPATLAVEGTVSEAEAGDIMRGVS